MKNESQYNLFISIINGIFFLLFLLFCIDSFTNVDITNQELKSVVYFGILVSTPIVLVVNGMFHKQLNPKIKSILFPFLVIVFILIIGPTKIVFSSRVWKTNNVLFINKENQNLKVEFQMQDMGALGYNKRTVEVLHHNKWFMTVKSKNKNFELNTNWIKVNN
ncbi:hypothetical protein [Flavobacterium sp.]|uniref:hypothetical protein n=1 Tax=Flavobacterium sp. TaxID=239 RepID=UPI003526D637